MLNEDVEFWGEKYIIMCLGCIRARLIGQSVSVDVCVCVYIGLGLHVVVEVSLSVCVCVALGVCEMAKMCNL